MDKHIELKITSPTTEVNVNSVDAEEVARIVQLAGIQRPPSTSATLASVVNGSTTDSMGIQPVPSIEMPLTTNMDASSFDDVAMPHATPAMDQPHGDDEMSLDMNLDDDSVGLGEQQAEFDFGNNPEEADGEEISPNDYLYQGPKGPQRIVRSLGDNALLQEIHQNLLSKYAEFLKEDAERENDDGVMSPLSDPTKPEFDKDPLSAVTPVDDGSHSPMSTIVRQPFNK